MNLRKKALVPAVAMVVASVIALSGVTYAWFTTGNTATVSDLNVNVQTANGIQVSLDAASWKSNLTATDIKNAITDAIAYGTRSIQLPLGEVLPVSSAGTIDSNGKMEMFFGNYDGDGKLFSTKETETLGTEGNFVAFDLFFKSSMAQEMTIAQSEVKAIALTDEAFDNVGTETAVRVAFLDLGSDADASKARGLKGNGGTAVIWEPNATKRAPGSEGEADKKLPYDGFVKEFEDVEASADNVKAVSTLGADEIVINLETGINKVRVYIWLEGQDVDCINNISFGDFATKLVFAVPEAE